VGAMIYIVRSDGEGGRGSYVGGLEGSLEDGDCVVLSCDIVETLWPTNEALDGIDRFLNDDSSLFFHPGLESCRLFCWSGF
jgi:hypothetical protein